MSKIWHQCFYYRGGICKRLEIDDGIIDKCQVDMGEIDRCCHFDRQLRCIENANNDDDGLEIRYDLGFDYHQFSRR